MNINSTLTSTRTAITIKTTNVWTSRAMARMRRRQRRGGGGGAAVVVRVEMRYRERRSLLLAAGIRLSASIRNDSGPDIHHYR